MSRRPIGDTNYRLFGVESSSYASQPTRPQQNQQPQLNNQNQQQPTNIPSGNGPSNPTNGSNGRNPDENSVYGSPPYGNNNYPAADAYNLPAITKSAGRQSGNALNNQGNNNYNVPYSSLQTSSSDPSFNLRTPRYDSVSKDAQPPQQLNNIPLNMYPANFSPLAPSQLDTSVLANANLQNLVPALTVLLTQHSQQYQRDFTALSQQSQQYQRDIQTLSQQVNLLTTNLVSAKQENDQLKMHISSLSKDSDIVRGQMAATHKDMDQLRFQLSINAKDAETFKSAYTDMSREIVASKGALSDLSQNMAMMQQDSRDLRNQTQMMSGILQDVGKKADDAINTLNIVNLRFDEKDKIQKKLEAQVTDLYAGMEGVKRHIESRYEEVKTMVLSSETAVSNEFGNLRNAVLEIKNVLFRESDLRKAQIEQVLTSLTSDISSTRSQTQSELNILKSAVTTEIKNRQADISAVKDIIAADKLAVRDAMAADKVVMGVVQQGLQSVQVAFDRQVCNLMTKCEHIATYSRPHVHIIFPSYSHSLTTLYSRYIPWCRSKRTLHCSLQWNHPPQHCYRVCRH